MCMVQEEHMANSMIRVTFYNIPGMEETIANQQIKWIGKISSMQYSLMQRKIHGNCM